MCDHCLCLYLQRKRKNVSRDQGASGDDLLGMDESSDSEDEAAAVEVVSVSM